MIFKSDVDNLIKNLKIEMKHCRDEDIFGYPKLSAYDVYKTTIERLKKLDRNNYLDVEKYYED